MARMAGKHLVVVTLATLLVAGGIAQAQWSGAATIRDESFYVASSSLVLGPLGSEWGGSEGWTITQGFQLNLEYQAGVLDKDIANINTYLYPANAAFPSDHTDGTWDVNFDDEEEYVLRVDCTGAGGLPLYTYPDIEVTGGSDIQWTMTAWHQTILAGDIVDNGNGTITLRVLPAGTYRPFPNDPPVNNVEIFDGQVACEVLGYTFTGTCAGIGDGSVLQAELVPEPATMGLLGLGLTALAAIRRKRRR